MKISEFRFPRILVCVSFEDKEKTTPTYLLQQKKRNPEIQYLSFPCLFQQPLLLFSTSRPIIHIHIYIFSIFQEKPTLAVKGVMSSTKKETATVPPTVPERSNQPAIGVVSPIMAHKKMTNGQLILLILYYLLKMFDLTECEKEEEEVILGLKLIFFFSSRVYYFFFLLGRQNFPGPHFLFVFKFQIE